MCEHDSQAGRFAGAAGEGVDDGEKCGVAGHAYVDGRDRAPDVHRISAVLEPVGGDLFVENRVTGSGGELPDEKEPEAKSHGNGDKRAVENSLH